MKRKLTLMVLHVLVMTMMLGSVGAKAEFEPFGSTRFIRKSASLSTSLSATFSATTFDVCNQLGLYSYSLYESNGTWVTGDVLMDYKASDTYTKTINLSSYGKSGKSYYVVGVLYADGESKTVTSATISY